MKTIDNTINHIGSKIKYYRLLNKISLSKLAQEANISKSTLFGLEEGRSNPTISTLINIATTLNISLNELIGNSIDEGEGGSNLTLVSTPDDELYKLYKLTLLPNELYSFNELQAANIEVEVIDGALSLIDKSVTLYSGESIVVNCNQYFKALNSGAIAMLKVYRLQDNIYIKEDIFNKQASNSLLDKIIKHSRDRLISRALFTSIMPISQIEKTAYMNYVEILANKESYYYIFKRYQGLIGRIKEYLSFIDNKNLDNFSKLESFIDSAVYKNSLNKESYDLLDKGVTEDIKELLIDATKRSKESLDVVNSIYNVEKTESEYILLIDDLVDSPENIDKLSLTIGLYRALEGLYIVDDNLLDSNELKVYNIIIKYLPKALYFAYNGYLNLAIDTLKRFNMEFGTLRLESLESIFINNFISTAEIMNISLTNYNRCKYLTSVDSVESIAKDLGLIVEAKEFISPVLSRSGLYLYLFKREK